MNSGGQGEFFDSGEHCCVNWEAADIAVITALHSSAGFDFSGLPPNARRLYELSVNALQSVTYARMSELPLAAAINRYEQKILAAANAVNPASRGEIEIARRKAADAAATDRGDADANAVLEAAYKVMREIHRLMGLLRFSPDENGVYIAYCEPDYFILPALGPYFTERFGETPWAIIDARRRLCLRKTAGSQRELLNLDEESALAQNQRGGWDDLWKNYHKTINNESRKNPELQRRFMPKRYWKYLNEV